MAKWERKLVKNATERLVEAGKLQRVLDRRHAGMDRHYSEALEKHPEFCEKLLPDMDEAMRRDEIEANVEAICRANKEADSTGDLRWDQRLNETVWETLDALDKGDLERAKDRTWDGIVVLLRLLDLMEEKEHEV